MGGDSIQASSGPRYAAARRSRRRVSHGRRCASPHQASFPANSRTPPESIRSLVGAAGRQTGKCGGGRAQQHDYSAPALYNTAGRSVDGDVRNATHRCDEDRAYTRFLRGLGVAPLPLGPEFRRPLFKMLKSDRLPLRGHTVRGSPEHGDDPLRHRRTRLRRRNGNPSPPGDRRRRGLDHVRGSAKECS